MTALEPPRPVPLLGRERVYVFPYRDPAVEAAGHDPRGPYARRYWLPLIGPGALVVGCVLADMVEADPAGTALPLVLLADQAGLGRDLGPNRPLMRTLRRLHSFRLARIVEGTVYVRTAWPPLTRRQIDSLPPFLTTELEAP